MAKSSPGISKKKLDFYEKLVASKPGLKRKGASTPYTSMNGHMFSFLTKQGTLVLRLPTAEREAFMRKYGTEPVVQHGSVMKEYVEVPDRLLENTEELKPYFETSYAYVNSLKPKPTKRKKSSK